MQPTPTTHDLGHPARRPATPHGRRPNPTAGAGATVGASHSPLTLLVVEKMRERILDGSLPPGHRLVEGLSLIHI